MTIADLKLNQSGKIISINGKGFLRHRLMEMGFTPQTIVTLTKVAPFGDPLELTIRNYEISIRKEDASLIEIAEIKR